VTVFQNHPKGKLARTDALATKRLMPMAGLFEKSSVSPQVKA
jgi:hypothetical protein